MVYQRAHDIEKRLRDMVELIRSGRHSSVSLRKALRVSQPTVARDLTALRERGYGIRAVRDEGGWWYELVEEPALASSGERGDAQ